MVRLVIKGDFMKAKAVVLMMALMIVSTVTAYAHHSFAATYDQSKTVTIEGKVAQFLIRSPHSFLHVLAKDENGQMQRWAIEWQGAAQLVDAGITKDTLKAGDPVIVTGNPGRAAEDHRIRMVTIKRTTDGFGWGNRQGQVVD
jgi:uncharacterized protein DUF6152